RVGGAGQRAGAAERGVDDPPVGVLPPSPERRAHVGPGPGMEELDARGDLAAGAAAEADASRRGVFPVPADRRNGPVTRAAARVFIRHPASSADLTLFILDIVDCGQLDPPVSGLGLW